jgi:citrate lyase subunit beta/citryl-CoA lyase
VGVRVNGIRTEHAAVDLASLEGLAGVTGVHVPKVETPEDVDAVLELLPARAAPYRLHCLIESALGVENAFAIATSRPEVVGISLGEADLRSELGATEAGLDWARSRIVNAAVAAGLPRPPQSVFPDLADEDGLARSCARGRELGHLGRAAIHPRQLPVILAAYLPTGEEVRRAQATIERLEQAAGPATLEGGAFVDAAMLGGARQTVALAERYGTRSTPV